MARKDPAEAAIAKLAALKELARVAPSSAELADGLRQALASKVYLVVARAAELVHDLGLGDLTPEIVNAFNRFHRKLPDDRGCEVTVWLLRALVKVAAERHTDAVRTVFRTAVRYVQMEASPTGAKDTAGEVRALCVIGLVQTGDRDAIVHATDLLADPSPAARGGAARALGFIAEPTAALLLRLKLADPDPDPDVTCECLGAILRLSPPWGVDYVSRYLEDRDPGIRQAAAVAMGESRKTEALSPLRERLPQEHDDDVLRSICLALAMLRSPEARDVLLSVMQTGPLRAADHAIEALALFKGDAAVRAKVEEAVRTRNEPKLTARLRSAFGV